MTHDQVPTSAATVPTSVGLVPCEWPACGKAGTCSEPCPVAPESTAASVDGFLREWAWHENAPRTTCSECHFEQSDCCDRHRNNHAPGCSQEVKQSE